MPSPEASRRNALKSTGPRTAKGKAAVRLNSLSHGVFAADLLLPGENTKAFRALNAGFRRHYRPATQEEEFLVNRMVLAAWRLPRLAAMESRVLRTQAASGAADVGFLRNVRAMLRGPDELLPPPPGVDPHDDPLATAWVRDANTGNTLVKLARYQTTLERSFYRALHEFQRLRSPGPST